MNPRTVLLLAAALVAGMSPRSAIGAETDFPLIGEIDVELASMGVRYDLTGVAEDEAEPLPNFGRSAMSPLPSPGESGGVPHDIGLPNALLDDLWLPFAGRQTGLIEPGMSIYSPSMGAYLVPRWRKLPTDQKVRSGSSGRGDGAADLGELDWGAAVFVPGASIDKRGDSFQFLAPSASVPEPRSWVLLATGTAILTLRGRTRRIR